MVGESWRRFLAPAALGAAACVACCAPPLVGLVLGAGAASALAAFVEPLAAILLASAALVVGLVLLRQRRQAALAAKSDAGCGCQPQSDRSRAR
jgi:hypothetical protein